MELIVKLYSSIYIKRQENRALRASTTDSDTLSSNTPHSVLWIESYWRIQLI